MYRIEVRNKQIIDGETGIVEEKAFGSFDVKNGKAYIRYKTAEDGVETSTTVIADGAAVTIRRTGAVSSLMVYRAGEKTVFTYRMPYGAVEMEIYTQKLVTAFDKSGGVIKLFYTLCAQGEKYMNNTTIRVTER